MSAWVPPPVAERVPGASRFPPPDPIPQENQERARDLLAARPCPHLLLVVSLLVGDGILALPDRLILLQIRLPRTLLAALVGGGLGLSGAVLQGALRNPLADPGLLGITGTAGLGAAVVFYWGLAAHFAPALPLGGLAGAAVGATFLLAFAGRAPSGPSLILAGIAVSALSASLLALALSLAPNPFALAEITFWLLGGLNDRSLMHVALAAPPILLGVAILLRLGPGLDALSLGEETAASLGVPVGPYVGLAATGTALAAGAGAAVAGGIGFVGLVVPHSVAPAAGAAASRPCCPPRCWPEPRCCWRRICWYGSPRWYCRCPSRCRSAC